jgi:hypothetical protein
MNHKDLLLPGIFAFLLIILQITFGFLMRKHRAAFLKYHRILGMFIFLVVIVNIFSFPEVSIIGVFTLMAVATQIILGFFLVKNKNLKKYHRPLGISIAALIIANLVLAFAQNLT